MQNHEKQPTAASPIKPVVSADYLEDEKIKLSCSDCGVSITAKENHENIGECNSCWDDKRDQYLLNK